MANVTMVENAHRRSRSFWGGFGLGALFVVLVLVILWFVGVVDVFPQSANDSDEAITVENELENTLNLDNSLFDDEFEDEDLENNTANTTEDEDQDEEESGSNATISSGSVSLTTARDVDESANPVGATELFDEDDERIYVVVEFEDLSELGSSPTVTVEWSKEGSALSDFDYELPDGQSRIYFYQNNAGAGDYEVAILIDGQEVASATFVVE